MRVWIVHHLQPIGEAASNVSQAVRECYPELPWVDMVSMRNILVHKYFGIDLQEVWDTATIDLPKLTPQIQAILKALKDQQQESPS